MKLSIATSLLLALSSSTHAVLFSNSVESPQILSDTSPVCTDTRGRSSSCEVELDVPVACVGSDGTSSCPIVFFFHGAGGTNDWFARTSGVHDEGMIGVYPQGEDGWNTGPKGGNNCNWDDFECSSDPDEGAFIAGIISELRNLGANGNIYLNGNSNGAALATRLAANAGDELPIKGIIAKVTQLLAEPPRSGPGVLNHNQPDAGGPAVSILNIMGTNDGVIPYEGGSSSVFGGDDSFQLMTALESMATWATHNGCSSGEPAGSRVNYSNSMDANGEATFYEYTGCPEGIIVEHYACIGAGHSFGQNAALDGVRIDYDLAFQFINRLEGGGGTPPAPSPPTPDATPAPVGGGADCTDDHDWHGKFSEDHNCDWVAEATSSRCGFESTDGTLASTACRLSCDTCSGTPPAPTPPVAPTPPAPTPPVSSPAPTTSDLGGCEDDPAWHGKFSESHTCDWIAGVPATRCSFESSDGTLASVGCKVACNEC